MTADKIVLIIMAVVFLPLNIWAQYKWSEMFYQ